MDCRVIYFLLKMELLFRMQGDGHYVLILKIRQINGLRKWRLKKELMLLN